MDKRHVRLSELFDEHKDLFWAALWVFGLAILWLWLVLFLNMPARVRVERAFLNTILGASCVVGVAFVLGWLTGLSLHFLDRPGRRGLYLSLTFFLNLLRSIPQMVGMLMGYVLLTILIKAETLSSTTAQLFLASVLVALFVFQDVADLIRERIRHYMRLDFVNALLVCGVSESRIVNREILAKNSLVHLIQKGVEVFGSAIFLVCSIDFIISIGLSSDVSLSNFPATLGNLLARLDSKQDILIIGTAFSDPAVLPTLLVEHLQGVSVAFLIVFTLLCTYKISNGIVERYRL